jgi:hypothetical protein
MKTAFKPRNINLTGTFDRAIVEARKTVATRYPGKVWNKKMDTIKSIVPINLHRGSSLWIRESAG